MFYNLLTTLLINSSANLINTARPEKFQAGVPTEQRLFHRRTSTHEMFVWIRATPEWFPLRWQYIQHKRPRLLWLSRPFVISREVLVLLDSPELVLASIRRPGDNSDIGRTIKIGIVNHFACPFILQYVVSARRLERPQLRAAVVL